MVGEGRELEVVCMLFVVELRLGWIVIGKGEFFVYLLEDIVCYRIRGKIEFGS